MKRIGILNAELSRVVARLGHGQSLVIADAGLPVPAGVPCIDLAVRLGVPEIWPVLDTVLGEMQVERSVIAEEAEDQVRGNMELRVPCERVSHADLKRLCESAQAVVRTGEATPYANIVLFSGVVF